MSIGQEADAHLKCPSCGTTAAEGSHFCASCGHSIERAAVPPPPATNTAQSPGWYQASDGQWYPADSHPNYQPPPPPPQATAAPRSRGKVIAIIAGVVVIVIVALAGIGALSGNSATSSVSYKDGYAEMNQYLGGEVYNGSQGTNPYTVCEDDVLNNTLYYGIPQGDSHGLFLQGCEAAASAAIQKMQHPGSGS